jgi:hypothetical protein
MGCSIMFFLVDQSRVVAFHCFAASQHQRVFLLFTRRAESGRVESLTAMYPLAM